MKRWFISLYLTVLAALVVTGLIGLAGPPPWLAPFGMMLAAGAPLAFFVWLLLGKPPRTDAHPVLVSVVSGLGVVLSMIAVWRFGDTWQPWLMGGLAALAGWMVYVRWYSRQREPDDAPVPGDTLPELELIDGDGSVINTDALRDHGGILLFYRGNWCPLCTAQIHELANAWRSIRQHNARLWFISSQSQKHTRQIAQKFDIPASFLRDPDNRAAKRLGIEAPGATPAGMEALGYPTDAALPTVIVVDGELKIRFIEVASNYRLRPDPGHYLKYLSPG